MHSTACSVHTARLSLVSREWRARVCPLRALSDSGASDQVDSYIMPSPETAPQRRARLSIPGTPHEGVLSGPPAVGFGDGVGQSTSAAWVTEYVSLPIQCLRRAAVCNSNNVLSMALMFGQIRMNTSCRWLHPDVGHGWACAEASAQPRPDIELPIGAH